jgi:hypothetical protein
LPHRSNLYVNARDNYTYAKFVFTQNCDLRNNNTTTHYHPPPMQSPKACGPPPSEAVYARLSTAIAALHKHAKCNGYAFFKRDTKPARIVFVYDRFGKPESKPKNIDIHESKRRPGSRSKKCDCRMKVALRLDKITEQWYLEVVEGSHNHEASADPSAHPNYRVAALDSQVSAQIESLALSGLNNAQILGVIRRQHSAVVLSQKDVSNLVQLARLRQ